MSGDRAEASRAVASLLREETMRGEGETLRGLSDRVQAFLATASTQPAQSLESMEPNSGEPVVELAVVAGVLEEKEGLSASEVDRADGLLLPTSRTQDSLKQRRLQEAQAMLTLMEALSMGTPSSHGAAVATGNDRTSNTNAATSSDEDEVVFMAAEDLENEESTDSDGDDAAPARKRRLIEEMN